MKEIIQKIEKEIKNKRYGMEAKSYLKTLEARNCKSKLLPSVAVEISPKFLSSFVLELVSDSIANDSEYWNLVRTVFQNQFACPVSYWTPILKSDRPYRECMMTEYEREILNGLPDKVTVYRGCTASNEQGISWTIDKEVAEFFADRSSHFTKEEGKVLEREISKAQILAFFSHENEVLILD